MQYGDDGDDGRGGGGDLSEDESLSDADSDDVGQHPMRPSPYRSAFEAGGGGASFDYNHNNAMPLPRFLTAEDGEVLVWMEWHPSWPMAIAATRSALTGRRAIWALKLFGGAVGTVTRAASAAAVAAAAAAAATAAAKPRNFFWWSWPAVAGWSGSPAFNGVS